MKIIATLVLFLGLGITALFADNIKEADSYCKQGMDKSTLQDYTVAIQDYNKAIELDPKDAAAYGLRGFAKVFLQDYTGAIQDFSKAIELNPKDAGVSYYMRGVAKGALKDKWGALEDLSKAGELGEERAYEHIKRIQEGN